MIEDTYENCCHDNEGKPIFAGDYVYIVGKCNLTDEHFIVTDDMKKFINDGVRYKVDSVQKYRNKVHLNGFMWHERDLCVISKETEPLKPKVDDFKFDEKLLDI